MNYQPRPDYTPRTCADLGVCQARMPACDGCAVRCMPATDADAGTDAYQDHNPLSMDSLLKDAGIWAVVVVVALVTVAVICGLAGYFLGVQP